MVKQSLPCSCVTYNPAQVYANVSMLKCTIQTSESEKD